MPHDAATSATYIRVASTSIAAYDYFRTLPAAWRFYEAHWNNRTLSLSLFLFILIRVISIAVLVLSNVGFFYSDFTLESCQAFYLVPPIFKVFQAMVSQSIMGVRTFNLARRSTRVGYFLLALYLASSTMQCYATMAKRHPIFEESGVCLATNLDGHHLGAWVYYAVCIIYDLITTVISVWFLLKYKFTLSNHSVISKLADSMLYDGMGYFVLLTVTNSVNLILYRTIAPIQAAAVTVGYVVTWIMSQKLLINLHEAQVHHRMANAVATGASIASQCHEHTDTKSNSTPNHSCGTSPPSRKPDEWTVPDFDCEAEGDNQLDVRVRMERVICVDRGLYDGHGVDSKRRWAG